MTQQESRRAQDPDAAAPAPFPTQKPTGDRARDNLGGPFFVPPE